MSTAHRISRTTPESTAGLVVSGIDVMLLVTLPWWDADESLQTPLVVVLVYLSLSQMWNLLAGFAGLISIGQQMFVGIGIYALLTTAEDWSVDPFLSVGFAGLVAAVFAVPVALLAFRLRGGYFAIGTWVIAEVFRLLVLESNALAGSDVRSLTRASLGGYSRDARTDITYWLAVALAVGATAIVVFALRSRLGLALRSLRDSESGARGLGVDITRTKLLVWVLAAFWTRRDWGGCTPQQPLDACRFGVQRAAVDRTRHLHRGHRRGRQHDGADHRGACLLGARRAARRRRDVAIHHPRQRGRAHGRRRATGCVRPHPALATAAVLPSTTTPHRPRSGGFLT